MRVLRKICAFVYLVAALAVLAMVTGLTFGPMTDRFDALLDLESVRIALAACLVIVTVGALEAIARAAAEREDVLVESVRGRVAGKDRSEVRFTIEAIAFTDTGLAELAGRVQASVERACDAMLGEQGVTALVRFLPSKTTIVTEEAPRERA